MCCSADDHVPTLEELRDSLQAGPAVRCSSPPSRHAAAAVAAAVRTRPDLCVLDITMPGNGIAACWELTARFPQVVVVMFTVSAEDGDLFAALRAGAVGYLLKDTDPARIPDLLVGATLGRAAIPADPRRPDGPPLQGPRLPAPAVPPAPFP